MCHGVRGVRRFRITGSIACVPISVHIDEAVDNLQNEGFNLQCESDFKGKLNNLSSVDFYKNYISQKKYLGINTHEIFMTLLFGS